MRIRVLGPVLLVAACAGEPAPPSIAHTVLGLGAVPPRIDSVAIAVFDEEGLVVSTTVAPPRPSLDLGVPAEVPLVFQVIARTATPAPAGFGSGLPAFLAREGRIIPLTRDPFLVRLEARPAGGLLLDVVAATNVPPGELVVRSLEGVPGVRFRMGPDAVPPRLPVVLSRGRQEVTYEPDNADAVVPVGRGAGLWVEPETISSALITLGARGPSPELLLTAQRADGTPLPPVEGATPAETVDLALAWVGAPPDPNRRVQLSVESTGTAMLMGLPEDTVGIPQVITGLSVSGVGRIVVRAEAADGVGAGDHLAAIGAVTVFNVGGPGAEPEGLQMVVANPRGLADGSALEIWTVDAIGRLTVPPSGTLSLADSDPWILRPDGDSIPLSSTPADARVAVRIALPSRPVDRAATVRADLFAVGGTLGARLGLP